MKAVIYARSATNENGNSLQEQLDICKEYAFTNGMEIVSVFSEISSGSTSNPKELIKAIELINSGEADVLITRDVSRLSRSLTTLSVIQNKFHNGINGLHFVQQEKYPGTSEGKIVLKVNAMIAESKTKRFLERSRMGIRMALNAGRIIIATPPFGYQKKGKELTKVENELSIVRNIFELAAQGIPSGLIAKELSDRSIPYRNGKNWNSGVICRIVENPLYAGVFIYGKTHRVTDENNISKRQPAGKEKWVRVETPQLACIDSELFNKANENLKKRLSPRLN